MTQEEKDIIKSAIVISSGYCNGGVRTFVEPDGSMMTNYVPFKLHFVIGKHEFGDDHRQEALRVWREIYQREAL